LEDGKPYLVDASITDATSEPAKAQQILEKSYHAVSLGSGFPAFIQDDIERRVNAALAGQ